METSWRANAAEKKKQKKKEEEETLSSIVVVQVVMHQSCSVHDIEPRDGPADTELSGPAIASSHGRVKARGAARGTGRTTTSHEPEQERGRRRIEGGERESVIPRSRENKETLMGGPLVGGRADVEDRRWCGRGARTLWSSVTWRGQRGGLIEASKKARRCNYAPRGKNSVTGGPSGGLTERNGWE